MLRSFCRFIVAQLPDLEIGTTLHKGDFPQEGPDLCTAVSERVPGRRDRYKSVRSEKRYQLMTRGPSYELAETEANRIFDVVVNLRNVSMSPYSESGEDTYSLLITEGNEPSYIGRDLKSRYLFSANLTLRVKKEI